MRRHARPMPPFSRGFRGRRVQVDPGRVPPGQYVTRDFPVLSAGPTPRTPLDEWSLTINGAVQEPVSWPWEEFVALPRETVTVDIHCVTKWSKLDTTWTGVSIDTLLDGVATDAGYVTAWCDGGYTTNLPLEDLTGGRGWIAYEYGGEPLAPEHGGPARLLVPHLYFWKSAKWVRGLRAARRRRARLLGGLRLPQLRRSLERAALLGGLIVAPARIAWRLAAVTDVLVETPRAKTLVLDVPGWSGHVAGQHVDVRLTAEDGYQAQRSYSIASAPEDATLALTVERLEDGEVSPYLTDELGPGDELELRGPIGGYFVWRSQDGGPLLLVAGGSGLVPLMAMVRHRAAHSSTVDTRLLLSARSSDDVLYRDELARLAAGGGLAVHQTFTREPPAGWSGFARRVDADMLSHVGPPPSQRPRIFICGPTAFVERAADLMVGLGHDTAAIHLERFGPTGG